MSIKVMVLIKRVIAHLTVYLNIHFYMYAQTEHTCSDALPWRNELCFTVLN